VLSKDFRHAVRALCRRPSFTIIVVVTLALGIGASVAIFGVTNAVLLRPLPYRDPARLASYGLRLISAGLVIGLLLAFLSTRVMETMLVGVKPVDPATFEAVAVVFSVIAGAAAWVPARRAARLDPTVALPDE
jgi:hypothetical protein